MTPSIYDGLVGSRVLFTLLSPSIEPKGLLLIPYPLNDPIHVVTSFPSLISSVILRSSVSPLGLVLRCPSKIFVTSIEWSINSGVPHFLVTRKYGVEGTQYPLLTTPCSTTGRKDRTVFTSRSPKDGETPFESLSLSPMILSSVLVGPYPSRFPRSVTDLEKIR